jgi:hypothetical protein
VTDAQDLQPDDDLVLPRTLDEELLDERDAAATDPMRRAGAGLRGARRRRTRCDDLRLGAHAP